MRFQEDARTTPRPTLNARELQEDTVYRDERDGWVSMLLSPEGPEDEALVLYFTDEGLGYDHVKSCKRKFRRELEALTLRLEP